MRFIILFLLLSATIFSSATQTKPIELKPFYLKVFAQTFKPVKAKANGTIQLQKCTSSQDQALNLWCYNIDTKIRIAEVHQSAKFTQSGYDIKPWYMEQDDRAFWKRTHQSVEFDYMNKTINTLYDETHKSQPLTSNVYDEVSYPLQIQKLLQQGQTDFKLSLISGHKLKQFTFKVIGKDTLFTKAGILDTTKVEHNNGRTKIIIWFAKKWDFLPIQFETYKSNKLHSRVTATAVTY